MFENTGFQPNDILFENLTEEERQKLINKRAEAQFVYEKIKAAEQKLEKEQDEKLQKLLTDITGREDITINDILRSIALLPPEQEISLKSVSTVLTSFAQELGNFSEDEKTEEFTNVCKNLAHAHKAVTVTDKKGGPKTDNDWNVMIDNLGNLSDACDKFGNDGEKQLHSDENNSTVKNLGKFARNRRESLTLQLEMENKAFIERMNEIKVNINNFVLMKRSFDDAGFDLKAGKSGDTQKLTPKHIGNSLKALKVLHSAFETEKNEDMKNRTAELASDILVFLDKNAEIKKSCGLAGNELKEISDIFSVQKNEILPG